jgi:hypothetical protein
MLEAKVPTPAGWEGGTAVVTVPMPTGSGVAPVSYAGRTASVDDHASTACRAGHRTVLTIAETECPRERRPTL